MSISVGLGVRIGQELFLEIMKRYACYLIDNKYAKSKRDAKDQCATIISAAIEHGDASIATVRDMDTFIDSYNVLPGTVTLRLDRHDLCQGVIEGIVNKDQAFGGVAPTREELDILNEVDKAKTEYQRVLNRLRGLCNETESTLFSEITSRYSNMFLDGFVLVQN